MEFEFYDRISPVFHIHKIERKTFKKPFLIFLIKQQENKSKVRTYSTHIIPKPLKQNKIFVYVILRNRKIIKAKLAFNGYQYGKKIRTIPYKYKIEFDKKNLRCRLVGKYATRGWLYIK